ncbi:hypothetical protein, partial [Adonisia turfae]|uniref:hypothetical protein n=1 Tax=Adonisia turfae TaxID=2950184 RepID=UPI002029A9EE
MASLTGDFSEWAHYDSCRTFEYSLPELLTLSEDAFLIGERRGCGVSLVFQAVSFSIPFADTKRIVPTPLAVRIAHHAAVDVVFRTMVMSIEFTAFDLG